MIHERWVAFLKSILSILLVVFLTFWVQKEFVLFKEKALPRLAAFKLWPQDGEVYGKSRIECVNMHVPDFAALAKALNSDASDPKVFGDCASYHQYVLQALPDRFDAFLVKGVCEYRLGRFADAESSLKKALVLRPNYFWNYYDLGMLYFNTGARDVGVKLLGEAVKVASAFSEEVLAESKIFRDIVRADDGARPRATFREATVNAQKAIAISCFFRNDFVCARDQAEAALKEDASVESLLLAGVASYQLGDYFKAGAYLTQVVEKDPSNGAGYFFLAMAFKEKKDAAGFAAHYKKAMELGFDIKNFLAGAKFPLRVY